MRRRAARRLYSRGRAPAEPAVDEQRKAWISSSQNPRTAYDACHVATAVCFVLLRIRITLQWRSSGRLPEAEGFRNGAKGKAAEAIVQCSAQYAYAIEYCSSTGADRLVGGPCLGGDRPRHCSTCVPVQCSDRHKQLGALTLADRCSQTESAPQLVAAQRYGVRPIVISIAPESQLQPRHTMRAPHITRFRRRPNASRLLPVARTHPFRSQPSVRRGRA